MAEKRERDGSSERDAADVKKARVERSGLEELAELSGLPAVVPAEECPEDMRRQIDGYLKALSSGKTVTQQLRTRSDFACPDVLPTIVRRYGIDEYATNLPTTTWAPPGPANPNGIVKV